MYRRICPFCKREFEHQDSRQIYCSLNCSRENRKNKATLFCEVCNIEYQRQQTAATLSRFCSSKCQHENQKTSILSKCAHCKTEFYVLPSRIQTKKYCSQKCYALGVMGAMLIDGILHKVCTECKTLKNIDNYGNAYKACSFQKKSKCRPCEAMRCRLKRQANPQWREKDNAYQRDRIKANPEYFKRSNKKTSQRLRSNVLKAYGNACNCCGETNSAFLCVDHIFNDGYEERKKIKGGTTFYRFLRDNGYPKDRYQLLCFNCNMGKAFNKGICPHQQ